MKPAERRRFELDQIAVLKWIQSAVIGTARQDVARLERVNRADPFDAPWNPVRHIAGIVILH